MHILGITVSKVRQELKLENYLILIYDLNLGRKWGRQCYHIARHIPPSTIHLIFQPLHTSSRHFTGNFSLYIVFTFEDHQQLQGFLSSCYFLFTISGDLPYWQRCLGNDRGMSLLHYFCLYIYTIHSSSSDCLSGSICQIVNNGFTHLNSSHILH